VPKVKGLKLRKARRRLVARHCRVGKITRKFSSSRMKGRVLAQKPKAGKTLPAGSRVNLKVGKGPRH
jgi:beta-lactam-binding protein with PASTA domain